MISKVKFYPTKTNREKKIYTYFISLVSIQKEILAQTVQIKNIMLELKTATTFYARWFLRSLPTKPLSDSMTPSCTVPLSSLPETQYQIPKMKGINKSSTRNFSLLPIFTDPSRGETADIQRIATNTKHKHQGPRDPHWHWPNSG